MTMERRADIGNKIIISTLCSVIVILMGILIQASMVSASSATNCAEEAKTMAYANTERVSVLEAQFYSVNSKLDKIDSNIEDLRDQVDEQNRN